MEASASLRILHNFIILFQIFNILIVDIEADRKLSTEVLCPTMNGVFNGVAYTCKEPRIVVYTRADGVDDNTTLHYVYSTRDIPTLLVAKTPLHANLTLDMQRFLSDNSTENANSLNFTDVSSVFVLVLSKVIEYVDVKDGADLNKVSSSDWLNHSLSHAPWYLEDVNSTRRHVVEFLLGNNSNSLPINNDGYFALKFRAFGQSGYSDEMPHLQFNENLTQVDIVLKNLITNNSNSRYALEMTLVAGQDFSDSSLYVTKSLDDERSPGGFRTIDWVARDGDTAKEFLQWKPICYTGPDRKTADLNVARNYSLHRVDASGGALAGLSASGLAYAFFGDQLNTTGGAVNVWNSYISFGMSEDKFYSYTEYNTWTFSVGVGTPPEDGLSLMIILIISIGLGIPAVIILFGGIFVVLKKCRGAPAYVDITSSYSEIN